MSIFSKIVDDLFKGYVEPDELSIEFLETISVKARNAFGDAAWSKSNDYTSLFTYYQYKHKSYYDALGMINGVDIKNWRSVIEEELCSQLSAVEHYKKMNNEAVHNFYTVRVFVFRDVLSDICYFIDERSKDSRGSSNVEQKKSEV